MSKCEQILKEMLQDIKQHQRDQKSLLKFYVEERLQKSLTVYYNRITASAEQLSHFDEQTVLNKLIKESSHGRKQDT